jgi:hypothetical protein
MRAESQVRRADRAFGAPGPRRWALGAYVNATETRLTFAHAGDAKTSFEAVVGRGRLPERGPRSTGSAGRARAVLVGFSEAGVAEAIVMS